MSIILGPQLTRHLTSGRRAKETCGMKLGRQLNSAFVSCDSACPQVVIVPIVKKGMEEDAAKVAAAVEGLRAAAQGAGLRVHVDDTEGRSPGWKFNFWEMKVSEACVCWWAQLCFPRSARRAHAHTHTHPCPSMSVAPDMQHCRSS